jgi:hypothetical protein
MSAVSWGCQRLADRRNDIYYTCKRECCQAISRKKSRKAEKQKTPRQKARWGEKTPKEPLRTPNETQTKKAAAGKRLAAAAEKPEMERKRAYCTRTTSSPCFTAPVAMASTEA